MKTPRRHAVAANFVFDGTKLHHDAAVLIEGSRVAGIVRRTEIPAGPVTTLPDGAWLTPGFVDIQVNGGGDVLFNADPSPDAISKIAAAHRRFGTTGFLPTLITDSPEKIPAAIAAVRTATETEPAVLGAEAADGRVGAGTSSSCSIAAASSAAAAAVGPRDSASSWAGMTPDVRPSPSAALRSARLEQVQRAVRVVREVGLRIGDAERRSTSLRRRAVAARDHRSLPAIAV